MAATVPSICSSLLVALFVWLLFSIMGGMLFAGKFYHCLNETDDTLFHHDVVYNETQCLELVFLNYTEVRWKNTEFNFDNVGMGFLSQLIMVSARLDSNQISLCLKNDSEAA